MAEALRRDTRTMFAGRDRWLELADRVFVRRHQTLDVNAGLVLGDDFCLVIDTRGSRREATELLNAVRSITRLPYLVVNTHAHFDHCFGNATFAAAQPGCEIWSSTGCAQTLGRSGENQRVEMAQWLRESGEDVLATELGEVQIMCPTHTFDGEAELSLGGRVVRLHQFGRGHTDHDVVVEIPDTEVIFVGDLVEQGAAPSFDDAYPLDWPLVLDAVLELPGQMIVPGHGDAVSSRFAARQRGEIAEVGDLARRLIGASPAQLAEAAQNLAVGPVEGLLGLNRAIIQTQPG
jgi:glyoxylase-like metal-dependent hydrolase (beta-lactamase superfamily II)